jgi:hypothetical protein
VPNILTVVLKRFQVTFFIDSRHVVLVGSDKYLCFVQCWAIFLRHALVFFILTFVGTK